MNLHRLISLAKEGWIHRPRAELFSIRALELRKMALGLDKAIPAQGAHARSDQDTYVTLIQMAQESPRDAVLEGWDDVWQLLQQVSEQRATARGVGTIALLNMLEHQKVLNFHTYALLRDMYAFSVDAAANASAVDLTLPVAQDYAIAVRGAQRLLHSLVSTD